MNIKPWINRDQLEGRAAINSLVSTYLSVISKHGFLNPDDNTKEWRFRDSYWDGCCRFIKDEMSQETRSTKNIPESYVIDNESLCLIQSLLFHALITKSPKPKTLASYASALMVLEWVLRRRSHTGVADFASLTVEDLDNACLWVNEQGTQYKLTKLGIVLEILGNTGIVLSKSVITYVNPISKKLEKSRTDRRYSIEDEGSKLPSFEAVKALSEYFANQPWLTRGDDPADLDPDQTNVLCSAGLALLMMVPARVQDLVETLGVNCLFETKVDEEIVVGINWHAQKTDMHHIKWVPHTINGEFENVVKEAIERIKYVSEPARQVYRTWDSECSEFDPTAYGKAVKQGLLPKNWPWRDKQKGLRWSDALFVRLKHQFHATSKTLVDVAEPINKHYFISIISGKDTKKRDGTIRNFPSFFERIGFSHLELASSDFNTHSFRHMVNTAARIGGMSEFDLNWWSHRKTRGEVYDHRTHEQNINLIATGDYNGRELTNLQILENLNNALPMSMKNLGLKFEIVPGSHGGFTFQHPLGRCIHNYKESPCLRTSNCLECPENLHCKGDKRTLKNLREELEKVNQKIQMAQQIDDNFALSRLNIRHEIVDQLVKVLGDDSPLEEGALVLLSSDQAPQFGTFERAKAASEISESNNLVKLTHSEACKQLGLARILPVLKDSSSQKEVEEKLQINDFLLAYEDDDE